MGGGPIEVGPLPPPGTPGLPGNVKISATCPSSLFGDPNVGFTYTDGNAHLYGDAVTGTIGVGTGGANAEGDAVLSVDGVPIATGFLHAWVGFNTNPNAPGNPQYVIAETIAFTGTVTSTGQSISINANPGGTTSASGHQNGWGQLNVNCS